MAPRSMAPRAVQGWHAPLFELRVAAPAAGAGGAGGDGRGRPGRALVTLGARADLAEGHVALNAALRSSPPPPPPSRTNWTRLVPPPVLTGHVSSLLPY